VKKENDPIVDMIAESGLDAAAYVDVAQALSALRAVVPAEAPEPSAELAALLAGAVVMPLALVRSRKRRIALASSALAATVVLGTGVAAASNSLPEGAQRFFSELSEKYLPFEFPSPDERGDESSPSRQGQGADVFGTTNDNGEHIGGGVGAGKTDNLGLHLGQTSNPAAPDKPTKPESALEPAQGPGNDTGQDLGQGGRPDSKPEKPATAATPTNKPTEPPGKSAGADNAKKPTDPGSAGAKANGNSTG